MPEAISAVSGSSMATSKNRIRVRLGYRIRVSDLGLGFCLPRRPVHQKQGRDGPDAHLRYLNGNRSPRGGRYRPCERQIEDRDATGNGADGGSWLEPADLMLMEKIKIEGREGDKEMEDGSHRPLPVGEHHGHGGAGERFPNEQAND